MSNGMVYYNQDSGLCTCQLDLYNLVLQRTLVKGAVTPDDVLERLRKFCVKYDMELEISKKKEDENDKV